MNERDAKICRLADMGDLSYAEIGRLYDISKQRVGQIVKNHPHEASASQEAADNG